MAPTRRVGAIPIRSNRSSDDDVDNSATLPQRQLTLPMKRLVPKGVIPPSFEYPMKTSKILRVCVALNQSPTEFTPPPMEFFHENWVPFWVSQKTSCNSFRTFVKHGLHSKTAVILGTLLIILQIEQNVKYAVMVQWLGITTVV